MLNKETCKKCWKSAWIDSDNVLWEQGKVVCGLKAYITRNIKDPPPEECPHYFEHSIAAGVSSVE